MPLSTNILVILWQLFFRLGKQKKTQTYKPVINKSKYVRLYWVHLAIGMNP